MSLKLESQMNKKIYICGMHSGQNPSAGVGIARSIRKAFPNLPIVGVDYWQGSSGLHDESVDEVLIFPQWKQIDRTRHLAQIRKILDDGNLWISALDVEVYWLAQNFGGHPNLLVPSGSALKMTAKPNVEAFTSLGFKVPENISAFLSDVEVHSFLRQIGWQCWLKGPYHDAKRISSWEVFEKARENMQKEWKTSHLFLQRHKIGNEESICFAAYHGELVSAVHMEKRLITPEGKTWAGHVTPVSPELLDGLKTVLRRLEWSGGGEIEYTRDPDGTKWIIECNPRFPAWIYGSALVGLNLPGRLVARALNLPIIETKSLYPFFTRVVQEVVAKEAIGIPMPPDPSLTPWPAGGQKGKAGPMQSSLIPPLRETMELRTLDSIDEEREAIAVRIPEHVPAPYSAEIDMVTESFDGETPTRIHLHSWTMSRFQELLDGIKPTKMFSPEIRIGYSIKTCPTTEHISKAQKSGFYMECISQLEIERALNSGAQPNQIILNGPGKFWPLTRPPVTGLHMLFADSIEELNRVLEIPNIAECIGIRICLPKLQSRFGVHVDEYEPFQELIASIKKIKGKAKLGLHFHMPSWIIGVNRWKDAFQSVLTWCEAIEQLTHVPIEHLDLGGGFYPTDLVGLNFRWIQEMVKMSLPRVDGIYFEPGRSLTQEGEIVVSRVLSVRRDTDKKVSEIVVDACVAELPLIQSYSHRIFFRPAANEGPTSEFRVLEKGAAKILGRVCMESDILSAGMKLPEDISIGDKIIFADAGAYERSMSYAFGRG